MAKPIDNGGEIEIARIEQETATFYIVGTSPLIMERMSEKAKGQLLLPAPKKNAAEKNATLKHDPLGEFRASAYTSTIDSNPTRLLLLSTAFKRAIATAATDIPGAKKAQIGRLTYVPGQYIDIYGIPKLLMTVVRSSDMNRTPDVRSRCIVPRWACLVSVKYITPQLRQQGIANLLGAAGMYIGVGGWRPEKGSGSFGQFNIVGENDKAFNEIAKLGRVKQDAALANPECYDKETEDLLAWYHDEVKRRGFKPVAADASATKRGPSKRANGEDARV